jgi:hypothetical protein
MIDLRRSSTKVSEIENSVRNEFVKVLIKLTSDSYDGLKYNSKSGSVNLLPS